MYASVAQKLGLIDGALFVMENLTSISILAIETSIYSLIDFFANTINSPMMTGRQIANTDSNQVIGRRFSVE
jgi:hypothetical protein